MSLSQPLGPMFNRGEQLHNFFLLEESPPSIKDNVHVSLVNHFFLSSVAGQLAQLIKRLLYKHQGRRLAPVST